MTTLNNYTALRAFGYTIGNEVIYVQGYSTVGDGGQGDFYWDSGSTELDNDGTIIGSFTLGRWKRVYTEFLNVKWFGAKGDGISNDSGKIQNAITVSASLRRLLKIPQATYMLNPTQLFGDESSGMAPTIKVALEMKSEMNIEAEIGTVFKIFANVSTLSSPQPMRLFFSNKFLKNIRIKGIIMDMNGSNNLISPGLPSSSNNFTQAQILFSGTISGVAAGANNVVIEDCQFINNAGVTCIGSAQSNTQNVVLGKNWIIRNNIFYNNGLNSSDHSSIFAWCTDIIIEGNTFDNPMPFNTISRTGGLVACEIHGSNQKFINNTIHNYYQGLWVALNLSELRIDNILISGNSASFSCVFVDFYVFNLDSPPYYNVEIDGVIISDNSLELTNDAVPDQVKQFLRIGAKKSPSNILFTGNICKSFSTSKSSCLATIITFTDCIKTPDQIMITNNQCEGIVCGLVCFFGSTAEGFQDFGKLSFINNRLGELIPPPTTLSNGDILLYGPQEGKVDELFVLGINSIVTDKLTSSFTRAFLTGTSKISLPITWNGITIGNGTINSDAAIDTESGVFRFTAEVIIGSTTTFTDIIYPVFSGVVSKKNTITQGFISYPSPNSAQYRCTGVVDYTGSWATLFSDSGVVHSFSPGILVANARIIVTGEVPCNGATI